MVYRNPLLSNPRHRKNKKKSLIRRSKDRFFRLTKQVHDTHQTLIEKGSPIRLCLYGDEGDLYMDTLVMDKVKKVSQSFTRPIKIDNLKNLVKSIHTQIGLVLDYSA